MKRKSVVTLLTALLFCSMTATAANYQVDLGDCRYALDSKTKKATVLKFIGPTSRKTVDIPDNIMNVDDGKTYTVTAIEGVAFYQSNVVTVNFPSTITSIGDCAFQDCPRLAKGKALVLPPNLKSIGMEAFKGCHFTEVTIPSTVTKIGESAFASTDLKILRFEDLEGSMTIGSFAFRNCKALTKVNLPAKLKSMGQAVFSGCTALATVTFPSSLTKIPGIGFQDCKALTSVVLFSGVTTIEWGAFKGSGLKSISLPATLHTIGQEAFSGCALTSIAIPAAVTAIPWKCFSGCSSLVSVSLPSTLKSIDSGAFWACDALKTIRCDAVTPPAAADESVFSEPCYAGAKLQIPQASIKTYANAPVWEKFAWLVSAAGVDDVVVDDDSAEAEYYTIGGVRVDGEPTVPGIYVVRRGSKTSKVQIR